MKKRHILLLLCFAVLSGCPTEMKRPVAAPAAKKSESPEAESLYEDAVRLFESERFDEADKKFTAFENTFGNDPLVSMVMLYRGRIAMALGKFETAEDFFLRVYNTSGDTPEHVYASLYLGMLAYQQSAFKKAVHYLSPVVGRFADKADNINALELLWQSHAALDDWQKMLIEIDRLLQASPADAKKIAAIEAVRKTVASQDESALMGVREKLTQKGAVWSLVSAQIAEIELQNEHYDAALGIVSEIRASGEANAALVETIVEAVESRNRADMNTIGCILPLSGKMRLVGTEVQRGVLQAAGQNSVDGIPMRVELRDSAKVGKSPEALVEELVNNYHVAAIVGPMDPVVSKKVANKAQQLGVPVIALTADESIANVGSYIFRRFASSKREVEALVQLARQKRMEQGEIFEQSRCVSLYPDNGYGRLMNQLLKQRMQRDDVSVVSMSFPPETVDFGKVVEPLTHQNFSILFLPMTPAQLALAAPALAAADVWPSAGPPAEDDETNIRTAVYLIPSVGYSDSLVNRAGRYLQGANFVVSFLTNESMSAAAFSRSFLNAYKTQPSTFAAYGYDAVLMIRTAVADGVSGRSALRSWLDETVEVPGLVHPFSGFDETGDANALPVVYSLQGTELQE